MKIISNTPAYQELIASATPSENIYKLVEADINSGRGAMNTLPLVIDFDLTLGSITINLPLISSLLAGGSMGVGFSMKGTIK